MTVIGAQWGDEGKGKVVDWLADRAAVVVRFQGTVIGVAALLANEIAIDGGRATSV